MDTGKEKKIRKAGKRSPVYPMISLEEAIDKAKILWENDKNNPIPLGAAYEHFGYKSISTYGARILAALKRFGLINEKDNDIILTNEAIDLMLHEPSDEKYKEIIKKMALKPVIYEKLFNEYNGQLPSDATLKRKLITDDYGFNVDKVDDFLCEFRKTIEFANLHDTEIPDQEQNTNVEQNMNLQTRGVLRAAIPPPNFSARASIEREIAHYPIGQGLKARILVSGASPVTGDAIKKLIGLLELNKDDLPEMVNDKNEASKQ
jgi:hypothetical protein